MRVFVPIAIAIVSCSLFTNGAAAAEEGLNLRGQLYFERSTSAAPQQLHIPPHVSKKYVSQTPIDFSYPDTSAVLAPDQPASHAYEARDDTAWNMDLTDGAKLKIAYDKNTKLSLGVGMWKVKMGVSRKFGGPSSEPWSLPVRHGRAAALGRADQTTGAQIPH